MDRKIKLIAGTANKKLAEEISSYINVPLTPVEIHRFNDGEIYCRVLESVRGCDIFLIQSTSPPTNENLMELLIMVDALKRASAREITAVIPYYGYARQDRKATSREPITARLVADLISAAGVDRVITFDLHVDQIQGFFSIPTDNLETLPMIADYFIDKKLEDVVVVSPDAGGTTRARKLAKILECPIAIIDKRRPKHGEAKVLHIIGKVKDKTAILIDDMIDSASTITAAAESVYKKGAKEVYMAATHAVFSGPAIERLKNDTIKEVVVSNTINIPDNKKIEKIKVISLAQFLAETIKRIHGRVPLGILYDGLYDKLRKKR